MAGNKDIISSGDTESAMTIRGAVMMEQRKTSSEIPEVVTRRKWFSGVPGFTSTVEVEALGE